MKLLVVKKVYVPRNANWTARNVTLVTLDEGGDVFAVEDFKKLTQDELLQLKRKHGCNVIDVTSSVTTCEL